MAGIKTFLSHNSCYQVDLEKKLIRRIFGLNPPLPRQGNDTEWRKFERLSMTSAHQLIIVWGYRNRRALCTITSPVREVEDADSDDEPGDVPDRHVEKTDLQDDVQ